MTIQLITKKSSALDVITDSRIENHLSRGLTYGLMHFYLLKVSFYHSIEKNVSDSIESDNNTQLTIPIIHRDKTYQVRWMSSKIVRLKVQTIYHVP